MYCLYLILPSTKETTQGSRAISQGSGSRATWTRWNRTNPEDGFPESSWADTWILTTKKTWKKPVQNVAPGNLSIHSISVLKSRHV